MTMDMSSLLMSFHILSIYSMFFHGAICEDQVIHTINYTIYGLNKKHALAISVTLFENNEWTYQTYT